MTALGANISSGHTVAEGNGYAPDSTAHVLAFSDGYKIALFRATISGSDATTFAIYNGSAWSASTGVVVANNPLSFPHSVVQVGSVVYIVWLNTGTNAFFITALPWSTFSHSMGTVATSASSTGVSSGGGAVSAVYDSTDSVFYVLASFGGAAASLYSLAWDGTGGHALTINHSTSGAVTGTALALAQNGQTAAVIYAISSSGYLRPITVGSGGTITPGTQERFTTSIRTTYLAATFDNSGNLDIVFEVGTSPVTLCAIKRTGTNVYSSIATLDTNIGTAVQPLTLCHNTSSDDLWVYYVDTTSQSNGEVFVVRRISGIWGNPVREVGGDSSGYGAPSAAATFDGNNSDFIYTFGTGSGSWAVYAVRQISFTAPNTPTPIAPTGTTGATGTSPTPAFSWSSSNPTPGDGQGAYEISVVRTLNNGVADSTTMWDSGQVTSASTSGIVYGAVSNASDSNYVAPATLNYGAAYQYQWKVRNWDSLGNLVSSYSSTLTFSLAQAPQAAIQSVASPTGGTASHGTASSTLNGATLASATSLTVQTGQGSRFSVNEFVAVGVSPSIDLVKISAIATDTLTVAAMTHAHSNTDPVIQAGTTTVTAAGTSYDIVVAVEQSSGDQVSAGRAILYDSSGTVIIGDTGTVTLGTNVSPGGTFTITNFSVPAVQNSTTYKLAVIVTDATTGATGTSELWTISESFTPPAAPTSPAASINADTGTITLSWANAGGATSVNVLRRVSGTTTWTTIHSGDLRTSWVDLAPLLTPVDYGLQTVNSAGTTSSITQINYQTLPLALGTYPFWLNDVAAPTTNPVCFGIADSDLYSASERDWQFDKLAFVPSGNSAPKVSYGPTRFWSFTGRTYVVLGTHTDGIMTLVGTTVIANLETLQGKTCLLRDATGRTDYVVMDNMKPGFYDGVNLKTQMDFSQTAFYGPAPGV